jgi:6-phosphogluconolactonase
MEPQAQHQVMPSNVLVFETRTGLEEAAAAAMLRVIHARLKQQRVCLLALSGGGTPRNVYRLVGNASASAGIEWQRVQFFFCDERMVPPSDRESNYRMVNEELFSRIGIPEANVHRIRGEVPGVEAASLYSQELATFFTATGTTFDLVMLGIGEDGHTASLFPGTDAVDEMNELVKSVYVTSLAAWRTTLTLPVINRSREIIFLVSGKNKASIVSRVLTASNPTNELPASLVRPLDGTLRWMLDSDAATLLPLT